MSNPPWTKEIAIGEHEVFKAWLVDNCPSEDPENAYQLISSAFLCKSPGIPCEMVTEKNEFGNDTQVRKPIAGPQAWLVAYNSDEAKAIFDKCIKDTGANRFSGTPEEFRAKYTQFEHSTIPHA